MSSMVSEASSSIGVHLYNVPCLMFFSITGIFLQIPVIFTHSGLFLRTNVPVIMMSLWYMYIMTSLTVAARYWHSDNIEMWWNGSGWCDFDVRMYIAASLGILSAQCTINWNIIGLLDDRPRLIFGSGAYIRGTIEFACCALLPFLSLIISTFYFQSRYQLVQGSGCSASTDTSVMIIMTFFMWIPILGAVTLFEMLFIVYRFWKRGRVLAMETMNFMPYMNTSQFVRIILFSLVVTGIFVPLIICVAIIDFISISEVGVHDIAWAHGKPSTWNEIARVNIAQLTALNNDRSNAAYIVNNVTQYINISIAWLLFACYGTGALAKKAYKSVLCKLKICKDNTKRDNSGKEYDGNLSPATSQFSFGTYDNEWDADITGAQVLKKLEQGIKPKQIIINSTSSAFSYSPPASAESQQQMI